VDAKRNSDGQVIYSYDAKVRKTVDLYIPELNNPNITIKEIFENHNWFEDELKN